VTRRGLYVLLESALRLSTFTRAEARALAYALQERRAAPRAAAAVSSEESGALRRVLHNVADELWIKATAAECAEGRAQTYENSFVLVPGDVLSFGVLFGDVADVTSARHVSYEITVE
jgi:hypothetical protein